MTNPRDTDLIRRLAQDATPVSRPPPPMVSAMIWFVLAVASALGVVLVMGLRPDFSERLGDPLYLVEVATPLMTSVLAAAAAFCASCPGRPVWERFAPIPPLALWLAALIRHAYLAYSASGQQALLLEIDAGCLPKIALIGMLPAILIVLMLRRGAPIAPITTTVLSALAAASLAASALRLVHVQDASIMILVWHVGSVALIAASASMFGRRLFRWPTANLAIAGPR